MSATGAGAIYLHNSILLCLDNSNLHYIILCIQKVTMYIKTTIIRLMSTVAGKFHYSGKTTRGF